MNQIQTLPMQQFLVEYNALRDLIQAQDEHTWAGDWRAKLLEQLDDTETALKGVISPSPASGDAQPIASGLLRETEHGDWPDVSRRVDMYQSSPENVSIGIEGCGLCVMSDAFNQVLYLEIYDGALRLLVWGDINSEDPTHTINLDSALLTNRKEDAATATDSYT